MAARIIHFDRRPRYRRLAVIGLGVVALGTATAFLFQPVPKRVDELPSVQPANSPWKISPFGSVVSAPIATTLGLTGTGTPNGR